MRWLLVCALVVTLSGCTLDGIVPTRSLHPASPTPTAVPTRPPGGSGPAPKPSARPTPRPSLLPLPLPTPLPSVVCGLLPLPVVC